MSFDYDVVVRCTKGQPKPLRAVAARLVASTPGAELSDPFEDVEAEDEEPARELDIHIELAEGGGTIELTALLRGYRLSIDSNRDGNRDSWEELGAIVDDMAAMLGEVVDDDDLAAEMIDESEEDAEPTSGAWSSVVLELRDRDGTVIETANANINNFATMIDPGGMPIERGTATHPLLTEKHRFEARGSELTAVLHDYAGKPFRRYVWKLDGYGRVISATVNEI